MMADMEPALQLQNVSKQFGSFTALSDVSIRFERGKVHALMGENGAGKSTLVKMIAGVWQPSKGALRGPLGQALNMRSPRDAIAAGIGVVHQELDLFDNLTVAENIAIGPSTGSILRPSRENMLAKAIHALGMLEDTRISPSALVSNLTTSEKQLVAIARALSEKSEIILFDEPTSSLNSADAALLQDQILRLKARGVTVIYITHKLGEVFEIADQVSVVRDGRHVSTKEIADVSYDQLISDMLGHNPKKIFAQRNQPDAGAQVALQIDDIHATNVSGVSLQVCRGEIVALAGLPGAGAESVLKAIVGLAPCQSGRIAIAGVTMNRPSPRRAIEAGVAYLPSNRLADGILPLMSVVLNIEATAKAMAKGKSVERRLDALTSIGRLNVRTSDPEKTITSLSGGNQQKALIARWLMMKPGLLLLDDPTRGVDIGSKAEIYHLLRKLADAGMAVVFTSSDSIELAGLADRIVIFREGRVVENIQAIEDYQLLDRKIAG